jgi:hypothetical protein
MVIREQVNIFSSNEIQRDSQLDISASCRERERVFKHAWGITYSLDGLSAFRSKGCIVGVVVEGVEGVCKIQHFLTATQGKVTHHIGGGSAVKILVLLDDQ